jgi:hypothetical protein
MVLFVLLIVVLLIFWWRGRAEGFAEPRGLQPAAPMQRIADCRGGKLYPMAAVCNDVNVGRALGKYPREQTIYGCTDGSCCLKSCCQINDEKCTAGGGEFGSRFGNEGPPQTGPRPSPRMNDVPSDVYREIDFTPTPYHAPHLYPSL